MRLTAILSRYACRIFILSFAVVQACLFIVISLFDFAELQRRASLRDDITFMLKLKFVALKMPYLLEQVLPFAIFVSALYTFWRMNRYHELIVMRGAGISRWQVIFPMSLTAALIGCIDLTVINPFSAALLSTHDRFELRYVDQKQDEVNISNTGLWLSEKVAGKHYIYQISKVSLKDALLKDVNIFVFDNSNVFLETMNAKKAIVKSETLELEDGWYVEAKSPAHHFDKKTLLSSLTINKIKNTSAKKSLLSFWRLPGYIKLLDISGLASLKYRMYWHSLISRSFWGAALVLLAAAFACPVSRSSNTFLLIVLGLISGFFLYFLKDMAYALGAAGSLPYQIAAWIPSCASAMLGVSLLFYQEEG